MGNLEPEPVEIHNSIMQGTHEPSCGLQSALSILHTKFQSTFEKDELRN